MTPRTKDETIHAARAAAAAAVLVLEGARTLAVTVADPEHRRLREVLSEMMVPCAALAASFPAVRGKVAGLVYQSVEYRGFQGSSALHIVHQIAELLADSGERWLPSEGLTPEQLERLAEELDRALPGALDDWLRTHLDPELAELGRVLGAAVTDVSDQVERSRPLARIDRLVQPFAKAPGRVVLAAAHARPRSEEALDLTVEFPSEALAVVTEEGTRREIRGARQVRLFRTVVEAQGRTVAWKDMVRADMELAGERLRESGGDSTPRFATNPDSFRRTGGRIRKVLGKLAYHWHQDGQGARWDEGTQ